MGRGETVFFNRLLRSRNSPGTSVSASIVLAYSFTPAYFINFDASAVSAVFSALLLNDGSYVQAQQTYYNVIQGGSETITRLTRLVIRTNSA